MVENSQIDNQEINLIDLMYTLWKGKWKIALVVVISLLAAISHQATMTNSFTAITEIKPIGSLEINKYRAFNNMIINANANASSEDNISYVDELTTKIGKISQLEQYNSSFSFLIEDHTIAGKIPKVTSLRLLKLYLDILGDKSVFEDAIRSVNLLDVSQYNNDQEFNEAVIRLASSVKISSSIISANTGGDLETFNYTINFKHDDAEKWKSVLKYVDEYANKIAKKKSIEQYSNTLSFLLEEKGYRLEDLQVKINNFLIDYERDVSDRVAYLKEQSEIAVKLGIAKNTIEVQTFGNQNAMLSNVKTDSPFYLRGYDAINKEIELIELRDDKKAFIPGLFDVEKKKRAVEQDQTIKRIKLALQSDLVSDNQKFVAASLSVITTRFKYKDNKTLLLPALIGLVLGMFYVIISNAFQSYRVKGKKTN